MQKNVSASHLELVKKCSETVLLKGIEALRLSYLYDGSTKEDLKIPPLEIYVENQYKKFNIPNVEFEKLNEIIILNSFTQYEEDTISFTRTLFCFKSFINHSSVSNLIVRFIAKNLVFIFAKDDIPKG